MSIIDSIQLSGVTYQIQGSGGGGNPTVELTQAEYDALVTAGTVSADTYYIITDAQAGDLTNYYTKTETNTLLDDKADTATTYTKTEVDNAITGATSTKQDTLVSGTNIKTINNESLLGSGNLDIQGGKAVSGGTNISITTGETADTINCTLPISVGTNTSSIKLGGGGNVEGKNSFIIGQGGIVYSDYSLGVGYNNYNTANYTFACGSGIQTTNPNQSSFGTFNKNNSNVLFSVGNGTNIARHNAFEIRQNGDIYLSSGGTDIKLQDHLGGGGGGSSYTAGDGIDITNNVISVTGMVDTTTYDTYTAATDTALSNKQTTLTAGTNITIVDNVISATGGGGKSVAAGRGISVTTGETADTVSFNLPISAGTGTNSLILGYNNSGDSYWNSKASGQGAIACGVKCTASGQECVAIGYNNTASGGHAASNFAQGYMTTASGNRCHSEGFQTSSTADASHSEGNNTTASGNYSHSEGEGVKATNVAEHSQGRYNVSNKANTTWGDSGNTLFSVGNGTADNARHNAFEIRQNGDMYLNNGTSDIKLQDYLQIKVVKLTQSAYDAMSPNYDSNTLYIIKD